MNDFDLYEYQKSLLFTILEQRRFLCDLRKEDIEHIKELLKVSKILKKSERKKFI